MNTPKTRNRTIADVLVGSGATRIAVGLRRNALLEVVAAPRFVDRNEAQVRLVLRDPKDDTVFELVRHCTDPVEWVR
jgi:hypothetical protein